MSELTRSRWVKLARSIEVSNSISNPWALVEIRFLRRTRRVRFQNGFEVVGTPANFPMVESLVRLAYHGAVFAPPGGSGLVTWQVDCDQCEVTTPNGIRLTLKESDPSILAETFLYDMHFQGFDLTGKVIVDIGAYVGDSALYFASKGAMVIAYEPDPSNFRTLLYNLRLNPALQERIVPVNAAAGRDGTVTFHTGLGGGSRIYASTSEAVEVRSVSLRTLLHDHSLTKPFLLKSDCKGGEFDLVSQDEIRAFHRIAIEYSADLRGTEVTPLFKALVDRGFDRIRIYKPNWASFPLSSVGMIRAEKGE